MKELLSSYAFWFVVISIVVDYFVIFHGDRIRATIHKWRSHQPENHTTLTISNDNYIELGQEIHNPRTGDVFVFTGLDDDGGALFSNKRDIKI